MGGETWQVWETWHVGVGAWQVVLWWDGMWVWGHGQRFCGGMDGMWVWGMAGGSVGVWYVGVGAWPEVLWGYGWHVGVGHGRRFCGGMACGCGGMAGGSVGVWMACGCGAWPEVLWGYGWHVGLGHGRRFCGGMACGYGAWPEVLWGYGKWVWGMAGSSVGVWHAGVGHGRWLYRGSVSQYVFSSQCCHHYHCSFCVCLQVAFEIIGVISVLTNCALIGMDPEVQKLLPSDVTAVNMVIIFVAVEV